MRIRKRDIAYHIGKIAYRIATIGIPLYERYLLGKIERRGELPNHIGIIPDGNRRYAREAGIPLKEAYEKGAEKLREILEWCLELGIKCVTVYAFSTENFQRPRDQVETVMELLTEKIVEVADHPLVHKNRVRIKVIGRRDTLPEKLREAIGYAENKTRDYSDRYLNIAIGYGGRAELVDAVRKIAEDVKRGMLSPNQIDEEVVSKYLYTAGLPDPDLIIRTSGEERLSGFLLWQSAYSELYFCDVYIPKFRKIDFLRAIRVYQQRHRRFGR